MPEGDTVLVTARRLHQALAGRRLLATDFRVPAFATADLSGHAVDRVDARGKHLLVRTDAGVAVHSHLRMDGEWQMLAPGARWRGPAHEVRAVLTTADAVAVGFRLGVLELLTPEEEQAALGHLGPDVLGADWDPEEALRRLIADPARTVHEAVQDQRVMAGPGNVYANEVCFLRGLHPTTPVGRRRRPRRPRGADASCDVREPHDRPADHDRRHAQGTPAVGLRAAGTAVPAVRDDRPAGSAGGAGPRPLLVSRLPARTGGGSGQRQSAA